MIKNRPLDYSLPFVGRAKELAEIAARLATPECRLLTLTGLGGSGKTRLAIEAAALAAPGFAHGAFFVALQPLARSELLVPAIAQAVGLAFYGDTEPEQQLRSYLHEKTLLLILDNFEHLLDGAALASALLAAAPGLKILATSREALSLREEWLYPLKGLATPPSVYSTTLEEYEAVKLFLSHARRSQPDFDLAAEHEHIVRICDMTAGLPLAIELAASWLKATSAAQIARQMQCNLDFLSSTTRNIEQRHRSMRAVFDQSWALLSEHEQLIFARLSVFPGSFAADAAAHIAGVSFATLAAFVEKSLVQLAPADRFGIHEMLRQYASEKLNAYRETEATCARLGQYFAQLMLQHELALKQPQQLETLQAIGRDFENIRLAWEWSAKNQQLEYLHAMLHGLYLFGFLGSRYRETIAIFQQALEQPAAEERLLGRLLARRWGYLHWLDHTSYQEAYQQIEQALKIAAAETSQFELGFCHLMAAYPMINSQRFDIALPHLQASQALFEAAGEQYYVCWVLHRLGFVYYNLNDIAKSREYTEQSLALARATHNRAALVICLYNLGSDYIMSGDYQKGREYCAEALQVATETGHRDQIAHALSLLALCAFCQNQYAECKDYADRSWAIIEDINSRVFEPYNRSMLIMLACLREDYAGAARLNEAANHHSTNKMGLQLHYWALATLSCGLGRSDEARAAIEQMLQLSAWHASPAAIVWLAPCAAYALAEADPAAAVELLAWACTYPNSALGWARQWPLLGQLQARLREAIEPAIYQSRWEQGSARTFDSIGMQLFQEFNATSGAAETARQPQLTARETEILRLMAAGLTNPQIAAQLVIGAGTVKTHTLNIYRKLEVANRTQAIVRAQAAGILRP